MGTTTMKNKNFGYLVKEGVHDVFQRGFMSFAAVCVTVACLVIIGSATLLAYNLNLMVRDMEETVALNVYVDDSLSDAEAKSVGSQINLIANVQNATFISREDAMKNFAASMGDELTFDGVQADTFRHRFSVKLEDNKKMSETVAEIREIPGVSDIRSPDDVVDGFIILQRVLNIVSIAMIVVLLVVSLFIISNTVKLSLYDRREEIAIMKMVGATNGFIRLPFVVQGFILGILGAGIAFGLEWLLYDLMASAITRIDSLKIITMVPFQNVLGVTVAVYAAAGLFIGVFGSLMSIRKFLDV